MCFLNKRLYQIEKVNTSILQTIVPLIRLLFTKTDKLKLEIQLFSFFSLLPPAWNLLCKSEIFETWYPGRRCSSMLCMDWVTRWSPRQQMTQVPQLVKDDFELKSTFLYCCALKSDIKLFLWVVGQKSGEAAKITTSPGFIIGPTNKSSCTIIPTPTYYHSPPLSFTFAGSIVSSSVEDCQNVITASEAWIGQLTPSLAPAAGHHHPVLTITLPL